MKTLNIKITTIISNKYPKNVHPIQYYFELVKDDFSSFCLGIDKNLSNQPYYIYKNA